MKKVIMVCNAHLDIVWLWQWEEGAAEAISTFDAAANFCEEYDGFVFNHNEAVLYEWIEEYNPTLFSRIKALVAKGKWNIIGGWYLQPDCILLSGESFVRQILTGRRYFLEKFNQRPDTAVNFDAFGHSRGLVQILKKSGYNSYIVCRAGDAERDAGGNDFLWRGLDNSEIVVHYSDENYNTIYGEAIKEFEVWLQKHSNKSIGMFLWGVGNHGGGPSRIDIEALSAYQKQKPELELCNAGPSEYFSHVKRSELPVYTKSLTPVSEGCYTSQIEIKKMHRSLENELFMCEKMLSCAAMQGLLVYPQERLQEAQKTLLFSQFHDALPGSAIRAVENDTLNGLGHGLNIVRQLKAKAFFALSTGQDRVKQQQAPILVFNPHPFEAQVTIDCEVALPKQNWNSTFMLPTVLHNQHPIACQSEKETSSFEIDWMKRCVFNAVLPPFSMSRFDCCFTEIPKRLLPSTEVTNGCIEISGNRLFAQIDIESGLPKLVCTDGVPMLQNGAFRLLLMNDTYNSWGVGFKSFDDCIGEFQLMDEEDGSESRGLCKLKAQRVNVIEEGPIRTVVEAMFRYKHSTAYITYLFPKDGIEFEINLRVLWQEKNAILKLCIPTQLQNARLEADTAFGRQELLCDGTEQVMRTWCALSEKEGKAVAIINNGVHGVNCVNNEMRISLVRGAGYGMSDLNEKIALIPGRMNDRMDQGEHSYKLWLRAGDYSEVMDGIDNRSIIHNQGVMSLGMCPCQSGEKPKAALVIDAASVVVSALKKSENKNGFVLRLYESEGKAIKFTAVFLGCKIELSLLAFEVKTFYLDPVKCTCEPIELLEGF